MSRHFHCEVVMITPPVAPFSAMMRSQRLTAFSITVSVVAAGARSPT